MGFFKRIFQSIRRASEISPGVFTGRPSEQQIEDAAIRLEWEEDIPDLVSSKKCQCGSYLQLVNKYAYSATDELLGAPFIHKTYLVAECACKNCKRRYYIATAPSKIHGRWIE